MKKYKCSCGLEWFSEEREDCLDNDDGEAHTIKQIKKLSAEDYVEIWGDDLENENRHSLTNMPMDILIIVEKYVSKQISAKIMKELYESGVGLG